MLSRMLPRAPQTRMPATKRMRSVAGQLAAVLDVDVEQYGRRKSAVTVMMSEPRAPAIRPQVVTPPLVPGGTRRRRSEVMRRGWVLERMPSSEEKVSAATAA